MAGLLGVLDRLLDELGPTLGAAEVVGLAVEGVLRLASQLLVVHLQAAHGIDLRGFHLSPVSGLFYQRMKSFSGTPLNLRFVPVGASVHHRNSNVVLCFRPKMGI